VLEIFRKDRSKIVILQAENDEHIFVKSDQRLLNTCLELIIDNALKYTAEKGEVSIRMFRGESLAGIEVSDSGPGFSIKALESLYELFTADNLKYRSHGFGIGLATVKIILDTLGARLEICNLTDKGAMVRMLFEE
jgi:two-component system sensor histidine kinase TctE